MEKDTQNSDGSLSEAHSVEKNTSNGSVKLTKEHQPGAQSGNLGKKPDSPVASPPAGKKRGKGKAIFFLLLVGVIAGGGFYGWTEYADVIKDTFGLETSTGEPIIKQPDSPAAEGIPPASNPSVAPQVIAHPPSNILNEQMDSIAAEASAQSVKVDVLESQVASLQLELNSQKQRIQALSTTTREDWLLAEAEYLLRLANQRVLTEKKSRNALSLLESVDEILKNLDDPDLFPVRKALANDITRLRVAGTVDREGIYLKLDALVGLVPALDIPVIEAAEEPSVASVGVDATWYEELATNAMGAIKKLSGIVRVEKLGKITEPPLLPSEQKMLRINLRLALEQAQLALMREEQAIYAASLERAIAFVSENFMADDEAGTMISELSALAPLKITQQLPTVSPSIRALRDYIALLHNRYEPEPGGRSTDGAASAPPTGDGASQAEGGQL